ncbi:MAG: 30S ribosomal protein S3 [Parcubacteria group bacterium]|nr:30S ribosomal protein S3 [Parcubacteria group bacterium]
MAQKNSPIANRLGIIEDWRSRWFSIKNYKSYLHDDLRIREYLDKRLRGFSVDKIEIERSPGQLMLRLWTARPGLIIGRGGTGIEELKSELESIIEDKTRVRLEVQEIKKPTMSAAIVAEQIAEQIERRVPFRRTMKQAFAKIIANPEVKGAKIQISGRLDGSEIAREEHTESGLLPLQTLREKIDYAQNTAFTTYGTVGIKVWIYKPGD